MSESRAKIFVCQPKAETEERPCAERIARHLATQAFRRPVTDADVNLLMKFYEIGRAEAGGFDAGVTELVTAVLSSPDFLYRVILTSPASEQARQLNDLELASRLSFFLWSQGPDGELITLAANKRLSDPAVLNAQVARMLKDPRAQSLVENFALSWLNLGTLEQVEPLDPTFNAGMRANFETEIRLFLASVLLEDRSVLDLINANYTFVNESLARQYEIPGVLGPQFRRVTLDDENRWGLLGKGAVLLRTSYGDRTSPVLRGAWVLDRIMGTPPTPPPPNVNTDLSNHEGQAPTTVRARLELHRTNPSCQACHGLIDPLGLALENFDVTGRWRDVDGVAKAKIDATTVADQRDRPARPDRPASLPDASSGPVSDDGGQASDDVRTQSRTRVLRHAPDPADRARGRCEQLHVRRDRHWHRQQRCLPPPGARSAGKNTNTVASRGTSGSDATKLGQGR